MVAWVGSAAPTPIPPTKPMAPPSAAPRALVLMMPPVEPEAAPMPAPTPQPTPPKINMLRKRCLFSGRLTRKTSSLRMASSAAPSRNWMASAETVIKVPTCFFRVFSTTSIFWPACSLFSASQGSWGVCAREALGINKRHARIKSFRTVSPGHAQESLSTKNTCPTSGCAGTGAHYGIRMRWEVGLAREQRREGLGHGERGYWEAAEEEVGVEAGGVARGGVAAGG